MHSDERLIGFDAREMWRSFEATWSSDRKTGFLIHLDIDKPLSTDRHVWPSLFDSIYPGEEIEWPKHRTFCMWHFRLWQDLTQLQTYLGEKALGHRPYWIVGITILWNQPAQDDDLKLSMMPLAECPTTPPVVEKDWTFLGYDVSDGSQLSGLTNCGHPELDKQFAPYLNKYHLFHETEQATKFKKEMDTGVPEHAPFFIYGLYLVEKVP